MTDRKTRIFPPDWPLLLSPGAMLFAGLGPRRRAQQAFIAAGTMLACLAFLVQAAKSGQSWPIAGAAVAAIAGFTAGYFHDQRARRTQAAEDHVRAMSLLLSFDGPLEIRRRLPLKWPLLSMLGFGVFTAVAVYYRFAPAAQLCAGALGLSSVAAWLVAFARRGQLFTLSRHGIEFPDRTISWRAIESIDPWLAGAPFTNSVALVLKDQRLTISLAGATEQPGVLFAVIDALFQRLRYQHLEPQQRAEAYLTRPLPAPNLAFFARDEQLSMVLGFAALIAGTIGVTVVLKTEMPWLSLFPALVAIALFLFFIDWGKARRVRQLAANQDRIEQLQSAGHAGREPFTIRRKSARGWPVALTMVFVLMASVGWIIHDPGLIALAVVFGLPVIAIASLMSWWNSRGNIAVMRSAGILLPQGDIPWSNVADMELIREYRGDVRLLALRLRTPLQPRKLGERINSALSRGASDREIVVSLRGAAEDPAVIHELARDFWSNRVGASQVETARAESVAQTVRGLRKFRELPVVERWHIVRLLTVIFIVFGFTVHGAEADFFVSAAWFFPSLVIAALLTVSGITLLVKHRGLASVRNRQGSIGYFSMFLVVLTLCSGFSWLIIGRSLPDLFTRVTGTVHESKVSYSKKRSATSAGCPNIELFTPEGWGPTRFCARPQLYAQLKASGELRVRTRDSWFGRHIVSVATVDPLWQPQ